jgi:hypothetical protein
MNFVASWSLSSSLRPLRSFDFAQDRPLRLNVFFGCGFAALGLGGEYSFATNPEEPIFC